MDLLQTLQRIAIPRSNYSDALDKVAAYLQELLTAWGIPFTVQEFALRAHALHLIAIACLTCALLVLFFVLKRKPLAVLIFALAIPAIIIVEFELWIPTVSALISKPGENIIITFTAPEPVRELVFNAHYDSKTDYWDHAQRYMVYKWITVFFVVGPLLALWVFLTKKITALTKPVFRYLAACLAIIYVFYWCLCAFGFVGHILLAKHEQSFGAVDNAASVVMLLALAKDMHDGTLKPRTSNVTILLGSGEEVGLQGAFAYVKKYLEQRGGSKLPVYAIDLDSVGDYGNLIYPKKVGARFKYYNVDPELEKRIRTAWKNVSGADIDVDDKSYATDAIAFAKAGIPTIELGNTGRPGIGNRGLHSIHDNINRVSMRTIELTVRMLREFIEGFDAKSAA